MSDNDVIKLKPEINLKLITTEIWILLERDWHSVLNKQIFVNTLVGRIRKVIEEKGNDD